MRLAELQQTIQTSVLQGNTVAEPFVRGTEHFDARSRLQVYEQAFHERLTSALIATYPALHEVVGEAEFRHLMRAFVTRHPPQHFSIRYFGRDLDAFIASEFSGFKARGLSELARWEWTLATAFDAADAQPIDATALAAIEPAQWGELRFRLVPSLQRLCVTTNAVQWWRFATQQAPRPTRWRMLKPMSWALWRSELSTYFRSLSADEAHALDAAAAGRSFEVICEGLSEMHGVDSPVRAATLLRRWLQDGWIASVLQH